MKKLSKYFISGTMLAMLLAAPALEAADLKIGLVNFKTTVEKSKYGKKEQEHFESLKKQMESVLEEKEKALSDISNKLNDSDYMDGLSADAEKELKHKYRTLGQEMAQHQQQYMQILNQANMKILQGLHDKVNEASKIVAAEKKLDLIINDETTFYHSSMYDVSESVRIELDKMFEKEPKKS